MEALVQSSSDFSSFSDYYQNGQLSHFAQQHRSGGSFQIEILKVDQDAAEFEDPPIDQFAFVGVRKGSPRAELDFGDGWSPGAAYHRDFIGPQPANQACGFRLMDPTYLIAAFAPASIVAAQFDEAGVRGDPFRALYADMVHAPTAMRYMEALWCAAEQGGPANNLLIDGLFVALLGQMLVEQSDRSAFAAAPAFGASPLARVVDYIETHFDAPLLTSELAAIAGMSVATFGRSFKAATGISPHRFLTIRRIEHAKRMLNHPEMTLTQIAFACGFSSSSHFTTVFRTATGVTPSAFRKAVSDS